VFSASGASRKQWGGKRIGITKTPNVVGARLALVPNGARNVLEFLLAKKPHFGISKRFTPLRDEGKPRPYNVSVFWFWAIEIPMRVGDPVVGLCRRNRPAVGYPPYVAL
jgi:hypothetical protein